MNYRYFSPVEEDSNFMITMTAVNSITESPPSNTAVTTTAQAGKGLLYLLWPETITHKN